MKTDARGGSSDAVGRQDLSHRNAGDSSALVTEDGWALARVQRMQAMAETNAGIYGVKLLRGQGYPDVVMTDGLDALALRAVLEQRDDLLASLREFVTLYDGLDDALGDSVRGKVQRARAVLAKAEGRP